MADSTPKSYATDPTLFLYTSLTAGSSHIITATSRLETILKANKIPFRALDVATDEKARMLWGRRAKGRKLPGLVKFGNIVGDLEQIEEWNEYGELKMQIRATSSMVTGAPPSIGSAAGSAPGMRTPSSVTTPGAAPSPTPSSARHIQIQDPPEKTPSTDKDGNPITLAMRQAGADAASKARENTKAKLAPVAAKTEASPETKKPEEKEIEKGSEESTKPDITEDKNEDEKEGEKKMEDEKQNENENENEKGKGKENEDEKEKGKDNVQETEKVQESPAADEDVSPPPELSPVGSPESATSVRPGLRKDSAVESTPNIHAENVEVLGIADHHRTSGMSATSKEERASVAEDRASLVKDLSVIKEQEKEEKGAGEDEGVDVEDDESGESEEETKGEKGVEAKEKEKEKEKVDDKTSVSESASEEKTAVSESANEEKKKEDDKPDSSEKVATSKD